MIDKSATPNMLKATIRSSYVGVAEYLAEKLCYWQIALHLQLKQKSSAKYTSNPPYKKT